MGHQAVAVLDGGWKAWTAAGLPTASGVESRAAADFRGEPRRDWLVTVDRVSEARRLIAARDPRRYRGEREPLDPVAGHIPGAVNHCYSDNVDADGRFLPPAPLLRARAICRSGSNPTRAPAFFASSAVASLDALSQTMISKAPSARPAARRLVAALAMVSAMSFSSL